eukprot:CAMPEP_0182557918 /NCGR_PEP_ID=MMETSP1324-20130603/1675_1 /TAXON_ID=236786 /ORGANISM="Florenciella sp., Strain RCC1587" /LENGTH=196 /DNA_ID=CAMNT_0024770057 /DNA_START=87 /DNA_END=678 /DNA_ORIENTATION=+
MAEAKPGGKHLTAKYDFKALQTIMKIDDDFKEDLVPFFGVEDVDSLPEAAENFDVNEICNVESADSAFAMTRDEQVAALVAIVPQETGADGKSRDDLFASLFVKLDELRDGGQAKEQGLRRAPRIKALNGVYGAASDGRGVGEGIWNEGTKGSEGQGGAGARQLLHDNPQPKPGSSRGRRDSPRPILVWLSATQDT